MSRVFAAVNKILTAGRVRVVDQPRGELRQFKLESAT
jgi:hypothetical protein